MLHVDQDTLRYLRREQTRAETRERQRAEIAVRVPTRKLTQQRSERLVQSVARVLRSGKPTLFEYEGAVRHGVRSSLVLEGWPWRDADLCASQVVGAALVQVGAERPTWIEGQFDFVKNVELERYHCARCGGRMPDERRETGYHAKFCSDICQRAAVNERARLSGERVTLAEHLAKCALKSDRTIEERSGDCGHCGTPFVTATAGRLYCSLACSSAAQRRHSDRPCAHCGTTFRSRYNIGEDGKPTSTRFCSSKCHGASKAKPKDRSCPTCLSLFRPLPSSKRVYCSPSCNPRNPSVIGRGAFKCEEVG